MSKLYSLIINEVNVATEQLKKKLFEGGPTGPIGPTGTDTPPPDASSPDDNSSSPDSTADSVGNDPSSLPSLSSDPSSAGTTDSSNPETGNGNGESSTAAPKDKATELADKAKKTSEERPDTTETLKVIKAGAQAAGALTNDASNKKVTDALNKQAELGANETFMDAKKRYSEFTKIKEEKMNLAEQKLRLIVKKLVERKVNQLKESGELAGVINALERGTPVETPVVPGNDTYDAVRSLELKSRQAAMAFESDMRKELDLLDANKMDKQSQEHYDKAMKAFHGKFVAAVVDAVEAIKGLPKNKKEEQ